jgi:glucose/arabinose dehydrogenase
VSESPSERGTLRVTELVLDLQHPWGLAFLPDGSMLVTERPGFLRRIGVEGAISAPLAGVPVPYVSGQAGLLDVAVSPSFAEDRLVYLAWCEPSLRGNLCGTAVGRGRLEDAGLADFEVVFRQEPKLSAGTHVGARLVFDDAGHLFVTLGENRQAPLAQDLGKLQGKIVRIFPDGRVPDDNPFVGTDGARPEIWSYGNRNVQGAALHPVTRRLWATEHGPMGGDELNRIEPGRNYGWPVITDGVDYSGQPVPGSTGKAAPGMDGPYRSWTPSPALSGLAFCTDPRCGAWQGNLFSGALAAMSLIRLELDGERIVHEERLLAARSERIRSVVQGPDGALYLLTDSPKGKLLRVELLPARTAAAPAG